MSIVAQLVLATLFLGLITAIFGAITGFAVEKLLFATATTKSLLREVMK